VGKNQGWSIREKKGKQGTGKNQNTKRGQTTNNKQKRPIKGAERGTRKHTGETSSGKKQVPNPREMKKWQEE